MTVLSWTAVAVFVAAYVLHRPAAVPVAVVTMLRHRAAPTAAVTVVVLLALATINLVRARSHRAALLRASINSADAEPTPTLLPAFGAHKVVVGRGACYCPPA